MFLFTKAVLKKSRKKWLGLTTLTVLWVKCK